MVDFLDDTPQFHDFDCCGNCSWAAFAFDQSSQFIGLSCYYISHNPAELDLHQPDDHCDKL